MDLTLDLNALIGLPGAFAVIPILVGDVKQFCQGIPLGTLITDKSGSPWPLVRDAASIGWVFALWDGGQLPYGTDLRWTSVLLIGLVLGAGIGKGVDFFRSRSQ